MKKNKTLIILIIAFVVLLGGAYILYSQLGQSQTPDATVCEIDAHLGHNYLSLKTIRRHQKYN